MPNRDRSRGSFGWKVSLALMLSGMVATTACQPRRTARVSEDGVPVRISIEGAPREVKHPEWSKNVSIYEVNVRQYSPGGTFREFEKHLPRLKEMGVGILWFIATVPASGEYRIAIMEQDRSVFLPGRRFLGDYCLTLDSSEGAVRTLQATDSVETVTRAMGADPPQSLVEEPEGVRPRRDTRTGSNRATGRTRSR